MSGDKFFLFAVAPSISVCGTPFHPGSAAVLLVRASVCVLPEMPVRHQCLLSPRWRLLALLVFLAGPGSAAAQGPIFYGDTVAATISAPHEIDNWTFTASQGDYIAVGIGEVLPGGPDPGFAPWIRLVAPDSTQIASDSGTLAGIFAVTAPLSGTYTIRVADGTAAGTALGSYRLTLVKAPGSLVVPSGDEGGAMTNGANHAGTVAVGDLDPWTFPAAQGDYVAVSIGEVLTNQVDPGFDPWIRVIGPNGALVTSDVGVLAASVHFNAPLSGTYTVIVADGTASGDKTGNYLVRVVKLPGTPTVPSGDEGGPMTNGENHAGAITMGDLDAWTFIAAQGDYFAVSIGEVIAGQIDPGFDPWIRVIGPNGALVDSDIGALAASVHFNAPLSGTYTVIVADGTASGDKIGNYLLRVVKAPGTPTVPSGDEGGPMTNGQNHAGAITLGDLDPWTFPAGQGDYVAVSIGEVFTSEIDPGFAPWIRVIGPNGALVDSDIGALAAGVSFNAPLSGTYTVIVADGTASGDKTGNYLVRVVKVPGTPTVPSGDEGGPMTNGQNHPGAITLGDLDPWTFAAAQGDYVAVAIGEVFTSEIDPGFAPWIRGIGPNGALVDSDVGALAAGVSFNAPLSGIYTVIVADGTASGDKTGSYMLRMVKVPGTIVVPAGDEGGPVTNGANHPGIIALGDLDAWTFPAAKDDYVIVHAGEVFTSEVDPGFVPWIRVIGPDGALVDSDTGALAASVGFRALLSGTYTVVVADGTASGDKTGSYMLRVIKAPGAFVVPAGDEGGPMINGVNYPGTIPVGDVDPWTFLGCQATTINVTINEVIPGETDPLFTPWIRLIGPNGALLSSSTGGSSTFIELTAPLNGTYTVVVADAADSDINTGSYLLHVTGACTLPTVVTGVASNITAATAQLHGTVNPNGVATSALFQYGPTTAYGLASPATPIGAGASDLAQQFTVTGLACNTTYHFRMRATTSTATVNGADASFTTGACPARRGDFTGDGHADLAVFRPTTGIWSVQGQPDVQWGLAGDVPVPGDYDGNGLNDLVVYRPSTGEWFVRGGATVQWGVAGDIPSPADYNGDGTTDIAVFRPSTGQWFVRGQFTQGWGLAGDVPVPADYDGDGKADVAVYRPSNGFWYVAYSSTGFATSGAFQWGLAGDTPVSGDFDGDHRAALAVVRGSAATWFIALSGGNYATAATIPLGQAGDRPLAMDVDGDGVDEAIVFRPSTALWMVYTLASHQQQSTPFGMTGDLPAAQRPRLPSNLPADADGDGRADMTVFRPLGGMWFTLTSSSGYTGGTSNQWGLSGDVPVPGDYDGDRRMDLAVYRPGGNFWFLRFSASGFAGTRSVQWGVANDVPVPADYDGDGRIDIAVYRPSNGLWFLLLSSTDYTGGLSPQWGLAGDRPMPADYDGDGRADIAVYRPSTGEWFLRLSSGVLGGAIVRQWGLPTDTPIAADFDGDGRSEIAVFRPSSGSWFVMDPILGAVRLRQWGLSGDVPFARDVDGDGASDLIVFRPAAAIWFIQLSAGGMLQLQWGLPGDQPAVTIR